MAADGFGVRQFVNLFVVLIEFYLRHKIEIDEVLDSPAKSALSSLTSAFNDIAELNPRGPRQGLRYPPFVVVGQRWRHHYPTRHKKIHGLDLSLDRVFYMPIARLCGLQVAFAPCLRVISLITGLSGFSGLSGASSSADTSISINS